MNVVGEVIGVHRCFGLVRQLLSLFVASLLVEAFREPECGRRAVTHFPRRMQRLVRLPEHAFGCSGISR